MVKNNNMGMTPEQFLSKNMKWFAMAFFVLFLFKSVQSCNRNMGTNLSEKEYTHTIDSLTKKYDILERESTATIRELEFQLKIEKRNVEAAEKQAAAVQSAVEKTRYNTTTTVNVRGAEIDTTKRR